MGENKTWVHFPLHVAPSLPGSGVFSPPLGVFTECISAAFTRIWGQFASNPVNFRSRFSKTKGNILLGGWEEAGRVERGGLIIMRYL